MRKGVLGEICGRCERLRSKKLSRVEGYCWMVVIQKRSLRMGFVNKNVVFLVKQHLRVPIEATTMHEHIVDRASEGRMLRLMFLFVDD